MAVATILVPSHNFSDTDFNTFRAPTSPNHLPHFYRDFDDLLAGGEERGGGAAASVPLGWGGKPKSPRGETGNRGEYDFAFDVSEDRGKASVSADELFDGGVIKPLKPPAAARIGENSPPRRRHPSAVSISRNREEAADRNTANAAARGRERGANLPESSGRRAARLLSPVRDAQSPWERDKDEQPRRGNRTNSTPSRGHRKWRLKDLFLFRSASEGRAADRRHTSGGSGSGRRGPVSVHEVHYTVNRAVSEDLKKKTFLPYKQGILGRLAFNPAAHAHALANGFGFSRK